MVFRKSLWRIYLVVILVTFICINILKQIFDGNYVTYSVSSGDTTKYNVLLVYVYADIHPYALENLEYFVRTAVKPDDGVHYYFIVQQVGATAKNNSLLPPLPPNAWYVYHENKCFDLGTVGWFLRTHFVEASETTISSVKMLKNISRDIKSYRYFIFLNSSIRGPFFPPYYFTLLAGHSTYDHKNFYWYSIFTRRLNHKVKLVGCTISCETTPHVQSYLLVTDLPGLLLLIDSKNRTDLFHCYRDRLSVVINTELGISTRILKSGFGIDSLQTKYQGLDFNRKENIECNRRRNPYHDRSVDGITLDPYEIVFVKFNYKGYREAADRAAIYQSWTSTFNST
jgi:hypothetical protein